MKKTKYVCNGCQREVDKLPTNWIVTHEFTLGRIVDGRFTDLVGFNDCHFCCKECFMNFMKRALGKVDERWRFPPNNKPGAIRRIGRE